jgi:hypothetical protein
MLIRLRRLRRLRRRSRLNSCRNIDKEYRQDNRWRKRALYIALSFEFINKRNSIYYSERLQETYVYSTTAACKTPTTASRM